MMLLFPLDGPMANMSNGSHGTPHSVNFSESKTQYRQSPSVITATPIIRSTIDDFREIIREQSFIIPNNSPSSDYNRFDVPIKKYPPLPDIVVPNAHSTNTGFFRTETILNKPTNSQLKKQMFYHFAPAQRGHLPSISNRSILPTMSSAKSKAWFWRWTLSNAFARI